MTLKNHAILTLWQDLILEAQRESSLELNSELQNYLVSLLMRYTDQPHIAQRIFATSFMEASQQKKQERILNLQILGDECLIYAGLFPKAAEKRQVKLSYFVDLGRSAYSSISQTANDLYWSLALQFVRMMDILQSIGAKNNLQPLEAYEQWTQLGSERALRILQSYSTFNKKY